MADFSGLAGYEPDHDHTDDESDMDYTFEELEDGVHIPASDIRANLNFCAVDVDDEELEGDLVDEHDEEDDDEGGIATMTADDLRRLLAARGPLREVLFRLTPGVMDIMEYPMSSRRGSELPEYREPVPSPEGQELMASGNFGVVGGQRAVGSRYVQLMSDIRTSPSSVMRDPATTSAYHPSPNACSSGKHDATLATVPVSLTSSWFRFAPTLTHIPTQLTLTESHPLQQLRFQDLQRIPRLLRPILG